MNRSILILLLLVCQFGIAQHLVVPGQHQFARLNYNPGYAGVKQGLNAAVISRQSTQSQFPFSYTGFSVNSPIRFNSMGVGVVIEQSRVGLNKRTSIKGSYSYKIQILKGVLSFGLDVGVDQYILDPSGQTIQSLADKTLFSKGTDFVPLFGAGMFYQSKKSFLGLSMNRLVRNDVSVGSNSGDAGRTGREAYLVAGTSIVLTKELILRPSILVQSTSGMPLLGCFSAITELKRKAWIGLGYRWGSEYTFMAGMNFEKLVPGVTLPMKVGMTISRSQKHGVPIGNPFEIMISYNYKKRPNPEKVKNRKRIVSPIIFY